MAHLMVRCPFTTEYDVRTYYERLSEKLTSDFGIEIYFLDYGAAATEPIGVVARIMNCDSDGSQYYNFWARSSQEFGKHLWKLSGHHPILFLTQGSPGPEFQKATPFAKLVPLYRSTLMNEAEICREVRDLSRAVAVTNQLPVWIFAHGEEDEFVRHLKEHQGPFYTVTAISKRPKTWRLKRLSEHETLDQQIENLNRDQDHLLYYIGSSVPDGIAAEPDFELPLSGEDRAFCWPIPAKRSRADENTGNFWRFIWPKGKG